MQVITTPNGIEYARLASCKGMVRLESLGMKHSSGRSATAAMRREFNLKRNTPHSEVIAAIQAKMKELMQCPE